MITHTIKKLPKRTLEVVVKIPKNRITEEFDKALDALTQTVSVEGFRKGKVPKSVAEKHISRESVYQKLMRTLLPVVYEEIVRKEDLKPVMSPKIELAKAKEGEDWEIKFTIAEKPAVDVGDYKTLVKEVKQKQKKADIWVPGKEKDEKTAKTKTTEENQKLLNEILTALLKKVKIELSDLIIEEELNARLGKLLDDIQKIGMTVDAYLQSKQTTMEDLRKKYTQEIEDIHKLEFTLAEIAEKENIQVEPKELEGLFNTIQDERERKAAQQNAYFYAAVLRKQKTLDFLLGL